ncbi:hypothetical protein KCU71_g147, partial [Aureobasidium melanogenum]
MVPYGPDRSKVKWLHSVNSLSRSRPCSDTTRCSSGHPPTGSQGQWERKEGLWTSTSTRGTNSNMFDISGFGFGSGTTYATSILDVDLQSDSSTQVPSFDAKEITNPWLADRRLGSGNGFLPTSSDMLLLRELLRTNAAFPRNATDKLIKKHPILSHLEIASTICYHFAAIFRYYMHKFMLHAFLVVSLKSALGHYSYNKTPEYIAQEPASRISNTTFAADTASKGEFLWLKHGDPNALFAPPREPGLLTQLSTIEGMDAFSSQDCLPRPCIPLQHRSSCILPTHHLDQKIFESHTP